MRALLLVAALAGVASAESSIDLVVRLDPARRALSGRERIELTNSTDRPLDKVELWLFPNRFADRPAALDEVTFYWVYPERFDPGFMRLTSVRVAGQTVAARLRSHPRAGRDTLAEIALPQPLAPGASTSIEVGFDVAIPERYGGFGCAGGGCVLLGGFYPMLAGADLEAPPARAHFTGSVVLDGGDQDMVIAGVRSPGPVAHFSVEDDYLTLVVAPALYPVGRAHGGATLSYLSRDAPPPADDAERQIVPYTAEDYPKMVLDAAENALDVLAAAGAPLPPGTRLTLVAAPLRLELASAQPGMVVVSDRIFELLPAERARKFHERELVRAIFTWALSARDAALPARDRDFAAEAAAAYLTDVYTLRAWHGSESGQDVLSPVGFVPAIDLLIYAPQVAFADAYFGAVADPDRFHDDPRRFASPRPRGSLLYEKLRDRLPPDALGLVMRRLIVERLGLPAAAPDVDLRQWEGEYPRVDYRLGERRRVEVAGGWRHEISIEKIGAGAPVEPVEVLVVDGDGARHLLSWDGQGARGVVSLVTAGGDLALVQIDPRGRLVESTPRNDDPRYDDRDPPRWKFLYNGLGVVINFTNVSVGLLLDFTLRRIHDLHNTVRFQLFSNEATTIGGTASYAYRFGKLVTPAKVAASVGFGASVSRLNPGFTNAPSAGTRLSLSSSIGFDDRAYIYDPRHVRGMSLGVRWTATRFDDTGEVLHTVSLAADATAIVTPADGHTLVANIEGAVVAGDLQARSQLLSGGGALRGYGPAEIFGRARVTGHLEWRPTLRHDLDWNVGHLAYVRGMSAAMFVDAGSVSTCGEWGDLFAGDNLYASAGFGLRFFYDDFGVQPGMMALDVGVPLVLKERKCFGTNDLQLAGRPPVMVYLSFLPPF